MKKFAAPLQALAALFLCGSMAWMVFVLAGLDPTPPTAMDLQARNTQDLSFASMNSTAVALAKKMVVELMPTSSGGILLPVTGKGTATPVPTVQMTLMAVTGSSHTPTSFSLFSFLFQPTATKEKLIKERPTSTPTRASTSTLPPMSTATIAPTQTEPPSPTPLPPIQTSTDVPTNTHVPATSTNTQEPSPTSMPPSPVPTTPVPPTPIPTNPPTSQPTNPPANTSTPVPIVATTEPAPTSTP